MSLAYVEITGKYVRTKYVNTSQEGSGYAVVVYTTTDIDALPAGAVEGLGDIRTLEFVASGNSLPTAENIVFSLIGNFSYNKKYKEWQLQVRSFGLHEESNSSSAHAFLAACGEKIMSRLSAARCLRQHGNDFFDVLTNTPERLLEIDGIDRVCLGKVKAYYHEHYSLHEIHKFLMPLEAANDKVSRALKERGSDLVEDIKNDPFCLYDVAGFDLEDCLKLAAYHGIELKSRNTISYALKSVLVTDARKNGSVYLPRQTLVEATRKRLARAKVDVKEEDINYVLDALLTYEKFVCKDNDSIYLPQLYTAEEQLAEKIVAINRYHAQNLVEDEAAMAMAMEAAVKTLSFTPAEKQLEAVEKCLRSGVSVITGGPGTGKSTVLDLVIKAYCGLHKDASVALMAPSGKAASRMAECTNRSASTIHKFLGCTGDIEKDTPTKVYHPAFHADLVVVDETSMVDLYVANALFRALPDSTKVVLVGDVNQLPSIGPGNVLYSIIHSGCVNTTELNTVQRQGADSPIVSNAQRIKDGDPYLHYEDDFQFVQCSDEEETHSRVVSIFMQEMSRVGLENVVVLSPYRKYRKTAATEIAESLQDRVNPLPEDGDRMEIHLMGRKLRKGDRIMQTRNTEYLNNGDIGVVKRVCGEDPDNGVYERYAIADFGGKEFTLEGEALLNVISALSYTIHKSQGSEYKTVIIPLFEGKAKSDFITRNLIYTAVTRAKQRVIFVGDERVLRYAIENNEQKPRYSHLEDGILNMTSDNEKEKTEMDNKRQQSMADEFCSIIGANIQRNGIEALLQWLIEKSDFLTSPYAEKGYCSYEGGLLEHSLRTYRHLQTANMQLEKPYPEDTIALVGLLHDICTACTFKTEVRKRKNADGVWEDVPSYVKRSDTLALGHGEKSLAILQMFLPSTIYRDEQDRELVKSALSSEEMMAIRWHEGANDPSVQRGDVSLEELCKRSKLTYLLIRANQDAMFLRGAM